MSDEPRYFLDAAGFVWREFSDGTLSMACVNPDNSPIPEPRTYLQPVDNAETIDRLRVRLDSDGELWRLAVAEGAAAERVRIVALLEDALHLALPGDRYGIRAAIAAVRGLT